MCMQQLTGKCKSSCQESRHGLCRPLGNVFLSAIVHGAARWQTTFTAGLLGEQARAIQMAFIKCWLEAVEGCLHMSAYMAGCCMCAIQGVRLELHLYDLRHVFRAASV
eukprot:1159172-Pelagomonas_calceolata.AAC.1